MKDDVLYAKLEVDLLRMGVDLLDLYRGKLSLRRLLILIRELPLDSLVVQEMGKREIGDQIRWDEQTHLMAGLLNTQRDTAWLTEILVWMKAGGKGPQPKRPEPIRPPGYQPPKPRFATAKEVHDWLRAL